MTHPTTVPSAPSAFTLALHYEVETALHEAGHTIMYALLDLPHIVTIEPDEEEVSAGSGKWLTSSRKH